MAVKAFFIRKSAPCLTIPGVELKTVTLPVQAGSEAANFEADAALASPEAANGALEFAAKFCPGLPTFLLSDDPGPTAFLQAQLGGFDGALPSSGLTAETVAHAAALVLKKGREDADSDGLRRELEANLALEQAALNIVTEYAFCTCMEEFSKITDDALLAIGARLNVDRTYLFLFDKETASNTNEWCARGVEPQKERLRNIPMNLFPRLIRRLKRGIPFAIGDLSEIPPESRTEKELLMSDDIRSLVIFPAESYGELTGFLGMDNLPAGA